MTRNHKLADDKRRGKLFADVLVEKKRYLYLLKSCKLGCLSMETDGRQL